MRSRAAEGGRARLWPWGTGDSQGWVRLRVPVRAVCTDSVPGTHEVQQDLG